MGRKKRFCSRRFCLPAIFLFSYMSICSCIAMLVQAHAGASGRPEGSDVMSISHACGFLIWLLSQSIFCAGKSQLVFFTGKFLFTFSIYR